MVVYEPCGVKWVNLPPTYATFKAKSTSMVPLTSLSPLQGPASPGGEKVFGT